MDNDKAINESNSFTHIELEIQFHNKYKDIFIARIDDIEFCLEQEHYIAALSLALTLPDICGKAEFPSDGTTSRYIKWFNQFMTPYNKPSSPYSDDMPYLSGEMVYNLRNEFLHSGNPNIKKQQIKDELCKVDKFELLLGKSFTGDTSMVSYDANMSVVRREQTVNVYLLCTRLCKVARDYYLSNKEKFNFFNYSISRIDD